jgi:hypothetical protein
MAKFIIWTQDDPAGTVGERPIEGMDLYGDEFWLVVRDARGAPIAMTPRDKVIFAARQGPPS